MELIKLNWEFNRLIWKNNDKATPLSAENMNRIEDAIVNLIEDVIKSKTFESNLTQTITHLNNTLNNSGFVTTIQLKDYAKTSDISNIYATKDELQYYQLLITKDNKLSYELIDGTPTIPKNISELINDKSFITSAALTGYATEDWVQKQGYLTSHQDVSSFITKEVNNLTNYYNINQITPLLNTKEDKLNLKALAYKDSITKQDIGLGNVNNVAITEAQVTQISTNKLDIENINKANITRDTNISNAQTTANEAKTIAEGKSRGHVFDTLSSLKSSLKTASAAQFRLGDNLYIKASDVPDYWVSKILDNNSGEYGYYEISPLETAKVDLSVYAKTKDITDIKNGTIVVGKAQQDSNGNIIHDTYQTKITETNKLDYELIDGAPPIPTKNSELTNDSGYITSNDLTNHATKTWVNTQSDLINKADKSAVESLGTSLSTLTTNVNNLTSKVTTNENNLANLKLATERTASKAVGGITTSTTFPAGTTVLKILETMLFPYVKFGTISLSCSPASGIREKGTTVELTSVTVSVNLGSAQITEVTLYKGSISETTKVATNTSGTISSGKFTTKFTVDEDVTSTIKYYAAVKDAEGETGSNNASFFTFVNPTFYGVLNTGYDLSNTSLITGKTKELKSNKNNTFTYTASNQHPFIAYPASYGNLSSILDGSNLEYIGDFNKTTMNLTVTGGTTSYNIYVLKEPTDISNFKFIFK